MKNLSITTIQSQLVWEDVAANLLNFENKINNIAQNTHIIVLPEMFTTGFTMDIESLAETMQGTTMHWMTKMAKQKKVIITGSFTIQDNGNYFNRLVWMQPDGNYYCYDKKHLFSLANEDKHFTSGAKKLMLQVNGWKICPFICYDLRFPVWARQEKNNWYDVLLYVANWPHRRITAWQTLLKARAIENQSFVIGVNRVGVDGNNLNYNGCTAVLNPLGETLYEKENDEDINTIILQKSEIENTRMAIPFLNDADDFTIV